MPPSPPAAHDPSTPLRIGVIGSGRMGRLHTRVLNDLARAAPSPGLPPVHLAGVYDADPDHAEAVAGSFETTAYPSIAALLSHADAVVIAVPTRSHLPVALECLAHATGRGVHLLIEKPLAATVDECRQIVTAAKAARAGQGVRVQVGHVERFNPVVRAMTRLHAPSETESSPQASPIRPRFIEVTRVSPLTFRSIDVGVVLDMMIHDIDIVLHLAAGRPVLSVSAVGVSVIGDVEDVCNARVTFGPLPGEPASAGGSADLTACVANLTASRLALKTERKLRVFSPDAYVSLDYAKKHGIVARRGQNLSAIRDAVTKIRAGEIEDLSQLNYTDLVSVEELQIDDTEPLRAQLESFARAIATNTPPEVPAEQGLAAVELATRIVTAMGEATL